MKAHMTREELLVLHKNLTENKKEYVGVKLAYAVAKNLKTLSREVEAMQEALKPVEGMEEYEKRRIEICKAKTEKIEDGNFVFDSEEDQEEVEAQIQELREEFEETFKKQEEQNEQLPAFLQEDVEVDLHKVSPEDLNDSLDGELVGYLLPFIEE